jgi:hypothetical protein
MRIGLFVRLLIWSTEILTKAKNLLKIEKHKVIRWVYFVYVIIIKVIRFVDPGFINADCSKLIVFLSLKG